MPECPRQESNLWHTGIRNPRLYPSELRGLNQHQGEGAITAGRPKY